MDAAGAPRSHSDLALGPALFHWESQSTTTAASPTVASIGELVGITRPPG